MHGLNLENWSAELAEAKEPFNLGRLIRPVKEYHLLNPVIVDCTSSRAVADQYADFLREGFHVVTPNKRPIPLRWITITSCAMRPAARGVSSSMTLTLARACR
nr:Aspartokinase I/homoserine dehydrogenase I [Klebsiella pneumoniae]